MREIQAAVEAGNWHPRMLEAVLMEADAEGRYDEMLAALQEAGLLILAEPEREQGVALMSLPPLPRQPGT